MSVADPIDLDFRPLTYWPAEDTLELRISRVKGEQRRLLAESLQRQGELEGFADRDALLTPALSEEQRDAWGALDPRNMGGEFLPDLEDGEVEIARVCIASTTGDVFSIRARRSDATIAFRIVDEYGSEWQCSPSSSSEPLSLRELIELIDGAAVAGEGGHPGLVLGTVRTWHEGGSNAEDLRSAVWASSGFYPDLGEHYERAIDALLDSIAPRRPGKR